MTEKPVPDPARPAKSQRVLHREGRLKVALKANMAKRKAQARGRAAEPEAGDDNSDQE